VDDKLTAISSSTVEQAEGVSRNTETLGTFRETFDKTFPTYLAMGMTYDEFYNKDHTLTIAYRKAFELQREQTNQNLWLQGAYVYEAISRVAPLLHPFAKRPKAEPYLVDVFSGDSIVASQLKLKVKSEGMGSSNKGIL
jgi:hypothetical protein